jgi:cytochrome c-type biogenesis protein
MDLGSILSGPDIPVLTALLLGLLTAIAPCPLATNIAAVAYITRDVKNRKYAAITGSLYTLGRMFSYTLLGVLIIVVGMEIPWLSGMIQDVGDKILGPLLIIIGLLMLFIDRISFGRGGNALATLGNKVSQWGMVGGFLLGVIFALAFCPYSAVLFFGALIPIAMKANGGIGLPAVYAIGTGLPVLIFGTLLSMGIAGVATWLNAVTRVEKVIRVAMAIVFTGVGIYYVIQWIQS